MLQLNVVILEITLEYRSNHVSIVSRNPWMYNTSEKDFSIKVLKKH